MATNDHELHFPPDYETEEWIWTSKGYLVVTLEVRAPDPRRYSLTIRDPTRLAQDVDAELRDRVVFSEPNVIVVPTVDRPSIEGAIAELARRGFDGLVPDQM